MRVDSKHQLLSQSSESWCRLWNHVNSTKPDQLVKRVKLHSNSSPRSVKDQLAHLYAWHRLFLVWFRSGEQGDPAIPAPGFKWNQTPELNSQLHEEWKSTSVDSIKRRLKMSHRRIMGITESISEKQLLLPGHFTWTRDLSLGKYIASATISHYRWAIQSIKRIQARLES